MDFKEIKRRVRKREYLVSEHADEERTKDKLSLGEIEQTILLGGVIEERLDDPRGESRLIAGKLNIGWIHVVIGVRSDKLILVTVYFAREDEWINGRIRKR